MKLTRILANQLFHEGTPNGSPYQFLLTFEDGAPLRLRGASDGQGMIVDEGALDPPADLGECGTVTIEDRSGTFGVGSGGATLDALRALRWEGLLVGLQLELAGGPTLLFWVSGDELFTGDTAAMAAHWAGESPPCVAEPLR